MSVLVTGAGGFIAHWVIKELLQEDYKVVGSVISTDEGEYILGQFKSDKLVYEVVEDIAAENAFHDLLHKHKGELKYVLHIASPIHFDTSNLEEEIMKPAIAGTLNILNSIREICSDTIERVVLTSSQAAIIDSLKIEDPTVVFNEESWNPISWEASKTGSLAAYCGSKKFAEKAAWDFYAANKDIVKFKLSVINPAVVWGSQLFAEDCKGVLNASCNLINQVVRSAPDTPLRPVHSECIHVKDVAKAHLLAFQRENTIGKRLALINDKWSTQDIADIINQEFPQLRGKIPKGDPGTGAFATNSFSTIDSSKTKEILGFEWRPLRECVVDTVGQILEKFPELAN